jgi:hypothetical protein
MKIATALLFYSLMVGSVCAQDTTITVDSRKLTLPSVIIRNNLDYKKLIQTIKNDTSFYKAFRNLRILGYTSYNDIKMFDKKNAITASLSSKTKQLRNDGCRTMQVLEEQTTGNFYDSKRNYNYETAELYAGLFFTKGKVCGENNHVSTVKISTSNKKGMEKHKEQLKMLFFNPGKKIPGIPFIGDKLDLYDDHAKKVYDYRLDMQDYNNRSCYVFSITPKNNLELFRKDDIVVDEMTTWFDVETMDVLQRTYTLSYKAGVYDFNVTMEVEMTKYKDLLVPKVLRYKGNWDVVFKKRERGIFTATLLNFEKEK